MPVVLRTHRTKEGNLQKALARIGKLSEVRATPVAIRVEERLGEES